MIKKILPVLVLVGVVGIIILGTVYIFVVVREEREMSAVLVPMLALFVLSFVVVSVSVLMGSKKKGSANTKINLYAGMPAADLEKAGYTEDLRTNSWEEKGKEFITYHEWSSPSERVVITFEIVDGKVTDWYKGTLTDSQLERLKKKHPEKEG